MDSGKKHSMITRNQLYLSLFVCCQFLLLIGLISWVLSQLDIQRKSYRDIIVGQQSIVEQMEGNIVLAAEIILHDRSDPMVYAHSTTSQVLGISDTTAILNMNTYRLEV